MLLSNGVLIKWTKTNKKEFIKKGYTFSNIGDEFLADFSDVKEGSIYPVEIKCDYCNNVFWKTYRKFIIGRKNIKKDCCDNPKCMGQKTKESIRNINKNNKDGFGYLSIKENRLKELKKHIMKYGNLDDFKNNNSKLYAAIHNYKDDIYEMVSELGYNMIDLRKRQIFPKRYYENIDNLKPVIYEFINTYGRFPNYTELSEKLRIPSSTIKFYGGIQKIKSLFKYDSKNELKDSSGYFNRSSYEYMVAQFLNENKISYKREQMPYHSEGNFRSDFTIYTEEEQIHVEIWGYSKYIEQTSSRVREYLKNRIHKEELYKKYNITLISIEPSLFDSNSYKGIQEELRNIFNPHLNENLKIFDIEIIIPPNKISDDELFENIMKYTDNKTVLPSTKILQEQDTSLYNEMIKRFGSTKSFARKYNKLTFSEFLKGVKNLNAI